jgi:hypothetical protein
MLVELSWVRNACFQGEMIGDSTEARIGWVCVDNGKDFGGSGCGCKVLTAVQGPGSV